MLAFEEVTGLAADEYWIEARPGGAPSWSENTKAARLAHREGARFMGWAAHGDACGGFPGVSNDEMRQKVERAMRSRAKEFPEAEHIAFFGHGGAVEIVARTNSRDPRQRTE